MARLHVRPPVLSVELTRAEKVLGLLRDVEVPLSAVRQVEVVTDALAATRGLRAPGLAIPGVRKIGTWRGRRNRTLVSVARGQAAVHLRVEGHRWDELLVGTDDAETVAAAIDAARRRVD
jgi:hypothetical protein